MTIEFHGTKNRSFGDDERIFHYTSSEGLLGILKSDSLWASHFRFLNDQQEFLSSEESLTSVARKKIREAIAALKVNGILEATTSVSELTDHETPIIMKAIREALLQQLDPFVLSGFACDDPQSADFRNGLLQHWAMYGSGGGYALQINPHRLSEILGFEMRERFPADAWMCTKVTYGAGAEPPPNLADDYYRVGEWVGKFVRAFAVSAPAPNVDDYYLSLLKIISSVKDPYFAIEKEARAVIFRMKRSGGHPGMARHSVDVFFRGIPVPYVTVAKGELLRNGTTERILVGPHPENERRIEALGMLLESLGLEIELTESRIPYLPK